MTNRRPSERQSSILNKIRFFSCFLKKSGDFDVHMYKDYLKIFDNQFATGSSKTVFMVTVINRFYTKNDIDYHIKMMNCKVNYRSYPRRDGAH